MSTAALPVVAVVGRPNVGKSTLVNRFLGRREAVVEDVPGVTRDRVAYDAQWAERRFTLLDTGGWQRDARGMAARIAEQAEVAVQAADVVVLVVDATVGITDEDAAVARVLQRSGRPDDARLYYQVYLRMESPVFRKGERYATAIAGAGAVAPAGAR